MKDVRYPIGKFNPAENMTPKIINECIRNLKKQPKLAREAVHNLTQEQIDTPYREGGWTVRQVIHHIADAHLNAFIRFKLTLTEDQPNVKTFDETKWAELVDAKTAPIDLSLSIIDGVHARWVLLLEWMDEQDFEKTFIHPENGEMELSKILQLYSWHGSHHIAQIMTLRERMKW